MSPSVRSSSDDRSFPKPPLERNSRERGKNSPNRNPLANLQDWTCPSSTALTFALPSNVPEKRPAAQTNPSSSSSSGGPGPSNNFLNRLSRRLSQSGANLKRKVSKGNKAPVRRASEADKENRTNPVSAGQGTQEISRGTLAPPAERNVAVEVPQDEKPRKGTLKRGLRVSVMRRTKSEGAPGRAPIRRAKPEDSEEQEELVAVEPPRMNENQSEVSSHRGSYFYSNSLGVCWDGRETGELNLFLNVLAESRRSTSLSRSASGRVRLQGVFIERRRSAVPGHCVKSSRLRFDTIVFPSTTSPSTSHSPSTHSCKSHRSRVPCLPPQDP